MSRRAEYHRQKREQERHNGRKPLTVVEAARLNAQRVLPADYPPSHKRKVKLALLDTALEAIDAVERSGVLPYLERRLSDHPGKPSELSVKALLVAMVVAADVCVSYCRTDLCAVLNGLDAQAAYNLGLCERATRKPVSYHVMVKQCLRFEKALNAGWVDDDGTECGTGWFYRCFVQANITAEQAKQITAVAIDSTFVESWSKPYSFPDGENRPVPSSADPDAKWGWRSATGKTAPGMAHGFDLHMATPVRTSAWKGRTDNANLKDKPPVIPVAMVLQPAGLDVAKSGLAILNELKKIFPNLDQVVVDRGYSMKTENFNRPARERGFDIVMDYDSGALKKVTELLVGRKNKEHRLLENCGTFFGVWLPKKHYRAPQGLTGKKLAKRYEERAVYRYIDTGKKYDDGKIQLECPQCAGRIKTNKTTRKKNVQPNPRAPYEHRRDNAQYCCPGKVTIPIEYLDRYQKTPYGTRAWHGSYNRRPQSENLNSVLKNSLGLKPPWCRALGQPPRFVASMMLGIAHMLNYNRPEPDDDTTADGTDEPDDGDTAADGTDEPDDGEHNVPDLDHNTTGIDRTDRTKRPRDGPP